MKSAILACAFLVGCSSRREDCWAFVAEPDGATVLSRRVDQWESIRFASPDHAFAWATAHHMVLCGGVQ